MFCEECGKKIPDGSKFCDGCGAPVKAPQEPFRENYQTPYSNPYGAPVPGGIFPEEKKGKGTGVLIAVLSVVAVALVGVLIFVGIRVFGGKKDPDNGNGIGKVIEETKSGEESTAAETAAETVAETKESKEAGMSIAPSVSVKIPTTQASSTETTAAVQDYILPDSNSAYLTEADLVGLTREQLRLARNEIYARHGRKFKDAALDEYFRSKSWYMPTIEPDNFNENVFNDYEIANRKLIADYEKKMGY